jgi:chromosome partitioning protein
VLGEILLEYISDIINIPGAYLMIIVVGGIKGGSGKTTIATNLAVLRSANNRDVLLIDADDQETATDFTILRNECTEGNAGYTSIKLAGPAVRNQTPRLAEKYQDIIIDTGGRDTTSQRAALTIADLLLVPFVPRSFDIWTLEKVGALVGEIQPVNPKLKAYTFLNRADSRGQDNDEAITFLRESSMLTFIDTPLGARKAFSNAAAHGLGVTELKPPDPKASDEILILYRYIFDIQKKSQSGGER